MQVPRGKEKVAGKKYLKKQWLKTSLIKKYKLTKKGTRSLDQCCQHIFGINTVMQHIMTVVHPEK